MRVVGSELQMASTRTAYQQHETRESLRMWVGDRRPDFEGNAAASPPTRPAPSLVVISDAGRAAQTEDSAAIDQAMEAAEKDPRLTLLREMIYLLTGKEARVFDASELRQRTGETPDVTGDSAPAAASPERPAGFGIEYDYHESYREVEQTHFAASGIVRTADGKEIAFDLSLSMSRSYYEESNVSLRLGDAVRQQKDPLVLNFSGNAAALSDQRFSFDLDVDGQKDSINRLAPGSGFLALDRNRDGRINDGSELFGARSGDGFADLAAYDDDGNGWIDEADAVYRDLRIWTPDAEGRGTLVKLQDADVGAIALSRIATDFALRDAGNDALGQIRTSSVFLRESGGAGTIQQVDLSV